MIYKWLVKVKTKTVIHNNTQFVFNRVTALKLILQFTRQSTAASL